MQRRIAGAQRKFSWDEIRLLLAMLRATTLSGGARALGIDKSTASRRIDALESALGARLFVRTRDGIRPSVVGERLRANAERIEGEMRALTSAAVADAQEVRGLVRIATTEALSTRLVQGGLMGLRATYPELELEVLGGNRQLDLARGEADLALRVVPTQDPTLLVRVLGRFSISLFAAPSYLRARGAPRSASELAGHDVLIASGELDPLPESRWLRERPGVRIALRSSSQLALIEAAVRGFGLLAITRAWGEGVAGLDHVMELTAVPARPTWLVMHPDVADRPAVRLVAERIAEGFREFSPRP